MQHQLEQRGIQSPLQATVSKQHQPQPECSRAASPFGPSLIGTSFLLASSQPTAEEQSAELVLGDPQPYLDDHVGRAGSLRELCSYAVASRAQLQPEQHFSRHRCRFGRTESGVVRALLPTKSHASQLIQPHPASSSSAGSAQQLCTVGSPLARAIFL